MIRQNLRSWGWLALLPFVFSGCAVALVAGGAALGAGTAQYVNGELNVTDRVQFEKAWAATEKAIRDMNLEIVESKKDDISAKLIANDSDDRRISVRLKRVVSDTTDIKIRVGFFGDQDTSEMILDRIRKNYY